MVQIREISPRLVINAHLYIGSEWVIFRNPIRLLSSKHRRHAKFPVSESFKIQIPENDHRRSRSKIQAPEISVIRFMQLFFDQIDCIEWTIFTHPIRISGSESSNNQWPLFESQKNSWSSKLGLSELFNYTEIFDRIHCMLHSKGFFLSRAQIVTSGDATVGRDVWIKICSDLDAASCIGPRINK